MYIEHANAPIYTGINCRDALRDPTHKRDRMLFGKQLAQNGKTIHHD